METELTTLLNRAQSGDRGALNELLARLRPHLETAAQGFEDPAHPAESVAHLVQEAGVLAWSNLASFRGGETPEETEQRLLAWLTQILKRTGIDARRAARAQRRLPEGGVRSLDAAAATDSTPGLQPAGREATPSTNLRKQESSELIRAALEKLDDPLNRKIVTAVFVDGLSLRQAAEEFELTYDQIRHRYHKLLAILEKDLAGLW